METSITITGHRPNKLYGYNINSDKYSNIRNIIDNIIENLNNKGYDKIITYNGGALGIDQIFAEEMIKLKEKYNLYNIIAIPCVGQESKWPIIDKERYYNIINKMDKKIILYDKYTHSCMNNRNKYMVDRSNYVFSFWDGELKGGTYNCVKYAISKKKIVINYNIKTLLFEKL